MSPGQPVENTSTTPSTQASLADLGGWPAILGTLARGEDLSGVQASAALRSVLAAEATSAQTAAFCLGLRMKGETVDEMAALLDTLLDFGERVDVPEGAELVDTCGTGGDRRNTINVSTLAALVVAGTGGLVCKHGNRAASSASGSADVLEALGVAIDLGPVGVRACLEQAGMGFCFAPRYHSALRHAGQTRRELGIPTVFNFLGPLANPARARRQVLGVSDPKMAEKVMGVLVKNGATRALVVYGHDGLDELSTTTTSTVLELRDGEVRTYDIDPRQLGVAVARADELRGGSASENADAIRRILDGEKGPQRDFVMLNAAAGVVAAGGADDLAGGLEVAVDAVDSGRAASVLERLVAVSQAQAAAAR